MSSPWTYLSGGQYLQTEWNLFMDSDDPNRLRVEIKAPDGNWRHKTVTFK